MRDNIISETNLQLVKEACKRHFEKIEGQYVLCPETDGEDVYILTIANPDIFEDLYDNLYVDLFVNIKGDENFQQPQFNCICRYVNYLPEEIKNGN